MGEMVLDRRLATCLLMSKCVARSAACTKDALSGCGLLAAHVAANLPVAFCVESRTCRYNRQCVPEIFGCLRVCEGEAKNKSAADILLEKIKDDGGYVPKGIFFDAVKDLSGGQIDEAEKSAWKRNLVMRLGVRFNGNMVLEDPSLAEYMNYTDDLPGDLARTEQP